MAQVTGQPTFDAPPILSPAVASVSEVTDTWWIAHTKSRFEKAFAADLLRQNVTYFLPMARKVALHGGRRREVAAPLFPSYVFFAGDAEARYVALATGRLCQVIEARDQAKFRRQLLPIELCMRSRLHLEAYPFAVVGTRCRVTAGVLRGAEGIIVRRDKHAHVVLQVSVVGGGGLLKIPVEQVEPVS
jgi:hypothetical protein